ncbi:MAG: NMD3-related protein [Thermoplasmata archaeon]
MSDAGGEFCVRCGRTGVPVQEGVCAECFAEHQVLVGVVDRPRVVLCPTCGARMVGSHWERAGAATELTPEDLLPLLKPRAEVGIRSVEWQETGLNPLVRQIRAVARVGVRGIERTVAPEFQVLIEHRSCPECSRRAGHYFTARIQLRGPEGRSAVPWREERARLHAVWDRLVRESRADWRRSMSWEEELPEGYDFFFIDTVHARAMARWLKRRLDATLTESPTLYGRKDGQDIYRVTYCLRVPRPGPAPAEGVPPPRRSGRARRFLEARQQVERHP